MGTRASVLILVPGASVSRELLIPANRARMARYAVLKAANSRGCERQAHLSDSREGWCDNRDRSGIPTYVSVLTRGTPLRARPKTKSARDDWAAKLTVALARKTSIAHPVVCGAWKCPLLFRNVLASKA